jgi:putative MATE family efflux protein
MVGHLGTAQLGGLGIAGTLIQTALGLLIFLAYGTTPAVSRLVGAGRPADALARGRDGVALSLILGAVLMVGALSAGPALAEALGARGDMLPHATAYIHGSTPGLPAMLAVMALTGVLRGLGDARTPLVIAGAGAVLNVALNALLIYGAGLGVFGSGLGTSLTQWAMAVAMAAVLHRHMSAHGVSWGPSRAGIRANAGAGVWLVLRSVSMRASVVAMVAIVARWGAPAAAGHQILSGLFMLMALALDAIAIAAQTLIARELGASRGDGARAFLGTMVRWGAVFGVLTGVVLAALSPWLAGWFGQPGLREPVMAAVLVLAVAQPLCGVVFVLDGVLIGAGDLRYLALVSLLTCAAFLGMLGGVALAFPAGHRTTPTPQLAWTWAAWGLGFMALRAVTLLLRARGGSWMRLGAQT